MAAQPHKLQLSINSKIEVPFYKQTTLQIENGHRQRPHGQRDQLPTVRGPASRAVGQRVNPNIVIKACAKRDMDGFVTMQLGTAPS